MKFHICIRTVKVKDTNNGKVKVIYDAQEVISGLKAPIVKDAEVINKQRIFFLNLVSGLETFHCPLAGVHLKTERGLIFSGFVSESLRRAHSRVSTQALTNKATPGG